MIQSLVLPGRFPTTFYAYPEFTLLNRQIQDEVRFENLNLLFWEYIFSADFLRFLRQQLGATAAPQLNPLEAILDSGILATLQDKKRFYDPKQYLTAINALGSYLSAASNLLRQFSNGNLQSLSVYGMAYDMQRPLSKLLAYAASDRNPVMDFYRSRSKLIRQFFNAEIVSAVTYNYTDILHLGILSARYRRAGTAVLIHGHSWENLAIDYLLEHSRCYNGLLRPIDGVVLAEDELAETFNQLTVTGPTAKTPNLHRFGDKFTPVNSPRRSAMADLDFVRLHQEAERQRPRIFAPELVILHRLSSQGCYWSRCTFCRHNSLHPGQCHELVDATQWPTMLRQLVKISPFLVFCDQGIDPDAAVKLASITPRKLHWSLRTRIDPRWDVSRIAAVARGGCNELIFGLESINATTLRRMNKTLLTGKAYRALVEQIHRHSAASGIYNHYCTIYGYPGESFEQCRQTVRFLAGLIRSVPKTTFSLNRFQLLYKSDIYKSPTAYGIRSVTKAPAMSNLFWYDEPRSQRSIELMENGLMDFYRTIGYRKEILTTPILADLVPAFLNDSGHAPLLKAGHSHNPFRAWA